MRSDMIVIDLGFFCRLPLSYLLPVVGDRKLTLLYPHRSPSDGPGWDQAVPLEDFTSTCFSL